jgi:hypothetical protein
MLEVAHMGLHVAQMTGDAAMKACFDAVTSVPAKILGLEGYGVEPGLSRRLRAPRGARSRRGHTLAGDSACRRASRPDRGADAIRGDCARPPGTPGDHALSNGSMSGP